MRGDQSYFQSFKYVQNKLIFSVPVYYICILPKKNIYCKVQKLALSDKSTGGHQTKLRNSNIIGLRTTDGNLPP